MIRSIVKRGSPLLRQRSAEVVDVAAAEDVITDMWDTLISIQGIYRFTRGSGLAAVQIGVPLCMNVVEFDGRRQVLINPSITARSAEVRPIREGCLSFFADRGMTLRHVGVTVEAVDLNGEPVVIETDDPDYASLLQHETDHLQGRLYTDCMGHGERLFQPPNIPEIP